MFERRRYEYELGKLQKWQEKNTDKHNRRIKEKEDAGADSETLEKLRYEWHLESCLNEEQIEILQYNYLKNKADRYLIPMPELDVNIDEKDMSTLLPGRRLSLPAQEALRSKIDEYEKYRRGRIQSWIATGSGLIVAVVALVALLD